MKRREYYLAAEVSPEERAQNGSLQVGIPVEFSFHLDIFLFISPIKRLTSFCLAVMICPHLPIVPASAVLFSLTIHTMAKDMFVRSE